MLYETLKQAIIVFGNIYFGIIAGIIYELKQTINLPFKSNKMVSIFLDIAFCLMLAIIFLISVNFTNYGEIRLYIIVSFLLGFVIERISIGSFVAKLLKILYNWIIKLWQKIKIIKFFKVKNKVEADEGNEVKNIS